MYKMILLTQSTRSKSWTHWRESPGVRGFGCVRFNGVTMQRMRLPGNERMSYRQNFPSSLLAQLNLKDELPFKGVGFVTP
jgi:hypothetical protein